MSNVGFRGTGDETGVDGTISWRLEHYPIYVSQLDSGSTSTGQPRQAAERRRTLFLSSLNIRLSSTSTGDDQKPRTRATSAYIEGSLECLKRWSSRSGGQAEEQRIGHHRRESGSS